MATSLLESYKQRLAISESFYAQRHGGQKLDQAKKLVTARCLENISKFMTESFTAASGTQRADIGDFKKFALNIATLAVPNLIAYDIALVKPMTSFSGSIVYMQYTAGTAKGGDAGFLINDAFGYGEMNEQRINYTAATVAESHTATAAEVSAHKFAVDWTPVTAVSSVKIGTTTYAIVPAGSEVANTSCSVNLTTGEITFASSSETGFVANAVVKVLYSYDNVTVPQNDLPMLKGHLARIPLEAKARRIAVHYSQMAAFQYKNDYGMDLSEELSRVAIGELAYEIDSEIVKLIADEAVEDPDLVWSKTLPVGVSKQEHYAGYTEVFEIAKQKIYDRTGKFAPNFAVIASNVLPVLNLNPGFVAAPAASVNGPYFAGTLNGVKIFVAPGMEAGRIVWGVKAADGLTSAVCYAPYMPIVPTQLLGFADGGMTQGWSTLYDAKVLNSVLLVAGRITA